jgi:hypothetical protein
LEGLRGFMNGLKKEWRNPKNVNLL